MSCKSIGESLQEWIVLNCPYEDIKQKTLQEIELRKRYYRWAIKKKKLNSRGAERK